MDWYVHTPIVGGVIFQTFRHITNDRVTTQQRGCLALTAQPSDYVGGLYFQTSGCHNLFQIWTRTAFEEKQWHLVFEKQRLFFFFCTQTSLYFLIQKKHQSTLILPRTAVELQGKAEKESTRLADEITSPRSLRPPLLVPSKEECISRRCVSGLRGIEPGTFYADGSWTQLEHVWC